MITTIRFLWEYYDFPVWAYDENGHYVPVEEVEEFKTHPDLYDRFASLQRRYDDLFINSPTEFGYAGFRSEEARQAFEKDADEAMQEFIRTAGGRYKIQNDMDPL
ncbi:MAG: hypothetical protein LUE27_06235 [Clostridia bacterium]|nr:hypothetical protein [Clostridia bacterium]